MKNFISIILIVSLVSIVFLHSEYSPEPDTAVIVELNSSDMDYPEEENKENEENEGPELEQKFFKNWHDPYGNVLETEHLNQIWEEIREVPREQELNNA